MFDEDKGISRTEKIEALAAVAKYNPTFTGGIIALSIVAALLEAVGLSFILPIIELVQLDGDPTADANGLLLAFVTVYQTLGIPFTLGFVVAGVTVVMTVRYTTSFVVGWLRAAVQTYYIRDIQKRAFGNALDARIEYFDREGSDDILNAIITQTNYAGRVIQRCIKLVEQSFLALVYLAIALIISPTLTLFALVVLGGITYLLRSVIKPGYELGDEVADANEERQEAVQAGTQGIRDTRVFGLSEELYGDFVDAVEKFTRSQITLRRNEAALNNFYNLTVAVSVFVLIYVAISFASLSFSSLGVFLFAMFQLGPKASMVNQLLYQIENDLPHLIRTQEFIRELEQFEEPTETSRSTPSTVERVEFDDIRFSYDEDTEILRGIDFEVEKGEFVAFVGQSGAGKSTIVSLLARMYEPDSGSVEANGVPIHEMDITEWRERLAVVRQDPYIFGDTLEYNLTIGNRNASRDELDRVCEIAKVDEFFDELPKGYDTLLGDDGVRLSGGQKQRVALARALLKDADLLVLDEATSDLDSNLEQDVQRAIEALDRDYATIAIAHRLSTVQNADRIYTVENGRIIEAGGHRELIQNDGKYAELHSIQ
ncbi:ABC transporter ATP-binding protein [Natrinema sp. LN54]|uniref:ABC transporter ATP-binding protein n=1 Tax=Natrinema sp. LN54 TaxID=3458705 RepID=UPI004035D249